MARQIGKMLNAREPKIVNGPQVLDKYVGESEANIRRLFADAEEEEKMVSVFLSQKRLISKCCKKIDNLIIKTYKHRIGNFIAMGLIQSFLF